MMDDLYREVILDHYQHPRGKGVLDPASVVMDGKNPLCGDEITLYLLIDGERVADVRWEGHGCSICMASASMLVARLKDVSCATADRMIRAFIDLMHGHPLPTDLDMGDIEVLEGVQKFPVRIKCALLPWTTLQAGLQQSTQELHHDHTQRTSFSY